MLLLLVCANLFFGVLTNGSVFVFIDVGRTWQRVARDVLRRRATDEPLRVVTNARAPKTR